MKQSFEQLEKDNDESISKLQQTLTNELIERKTCQTKLKEAQQKLVESEKVKQTYEQKTADLEAKLEEKNKEYEEKCEEYKKTKAAHDELNSILSYVKKNFKD